MPHLITQGLAVLLLAAATVQGAALDEDFLAARDAYEANNAARMDTHAQRLKGHLLEPYVAYWQLSIRIDGASPEEVRGFLALHRDSPLSERLRSEWLKSLAERGEWELFGAELPRLASRDVEITCYALRHRMLTAPEATLPEARSLWFLTRDLPDSCTPLLNALVTSGAISTEDLWSRIRVSQRPGTSIGCWP